MERYGWFSCCRHGWTRADHDTKLHSFAFYFITPLPNLTTFSFLGMLDAIHGRKLLWARRSALLRGSLSCQKRITLRRLPDANHRYRVILKKVLFGIFRTILVSKKEKKIYYRKQRQRAICEQVFMIFGHCQNHQNWTFKRSYQPKNHDPRIVFMQE